MTTYRKEGSPASAEAKLVVHHSGTEVDLKVNNHIVAILLQDGTITLPVLSAGVQDELKKVGIKVEHNAIKLSYINNLVVRTDAEIESM